MDKELSRSTSRRFCAGLLRPLKPPLIWTGAILAVWEAAGRILKIHPDMLPTPSRILLEWTVEADSLTAHGIITTAEMLGGFLLSLVLAAAAAVLLALSPSIRRLLLPVVSGLRQAPLIAAAPLAFIWLGFGFRSITWLAALISFSVLALGVAEGLCGMSEKLNDLGRLSNAGPVRTFLKLRLPCCLPAAFTAIRAAVPVVVGAVAVGEFVDGERGLGYLMLASAFKLETPLVLAALATVLLIGLALYGTVAFAEFALVRWPRGR